MRPKAKTDIRPQPKPGISVQPQQVMAMLGVLLMFAMALSWLWQPMERHIPSHKQEVRQDSLQVSVMPEREPISMNVKGVLPR